MARPERFELPTPWFVARYSIQLSYGRKNIQPTTIAIILRDGASHRSTLVAPGIHASRDTCAFLHFVQLSYGRKNIQPTTIAIILRDSASHRSTLVAPGIHASRNTCAFLHFVQLSCYERFYRRRRL